MQFCEDTGICIRITHQCVCLCACVCACVREREREKERERERKRVRECVYVHVLPAMTMSLCLAVYTEEAGKQTRASLDWRLYARRLRDRKREREEVDTLPHQGCKTPLVSLCPPAAPLTSELLCVRLVGRTPPPFAIISMETLRPRIAL